MQGLTNVSDLSGRRLLSCLSQGGSKTLPGSSSCSLSVNSPSSVLRFSVILLSIMKINVFHSLAALVIVDVSFPLVWRGVASI